MRIRTIAAAVAVLTLALSACGSDDQPDRPAATKTVTATPTPAVDPAAAEAACLTEWAEAIRQGAKEGDPAPSACDGVPDDGLLYARAVKQKVQEDRQAYADCVADPSCTEAPTP